MVTIASERLPRLLIPFYRRLAFARENRWADLLSGGDAGGVSGEYEDLPSGPAPLPLAAVYACIVRMTPFPELGDTGINRIYRQLLADRKWTAARSRRA